ncbi:hypothetical protein [Gemmatimonas sp.]|uniref:hypothetical protein n=1 Tax=Gemmatimonas sp. TaxID=1962908 RepID=UPI00286C05C9|nr:hypothetical protein [Gemmatimonas sp.]
MNAPALSIVLAVSRDDALRDGSLAAALSAIAQSVAGVTGGLTHEVIVVAANAQGLPLPSAVPSVRLVTVAPGALTPVNWGLGLRAATGRVVAFTTSQMCVSITWAGALLEAINRGVDAGVIGAGGPVALPSVASAADAATLVRFSAFLPGRWPRVMSAHDIPGDNAAYLRAHLVEHEDLLQDGFWEVEFHRRFARAGKQLLMVPAALATAQGVVDLRALRAHRFAHAVSFGISRVDRHGHSALRIVLAAPLVPLVLAARIARRARAAGVEHGRIRRAIPAVLRLTIAWAAGEAVGAWRAAVGRGNQVTFAHE